MARSFAHVPLDSIFGSAFAALFITRLIEGVSAQTICLPLMQSLVQQAEATNSYGSWDACCATLGVDCFLTRQSVPLGTNPCDSAHNARAGCNRVPEGTICMVGQDNLIDESSCGASQISSCTTKVVEDGASQPFNFPFPGLTPASILSRGALGSQLCCSESSCAYASLGACTSQYNMTCVSDGINFICVPFDQPNANSYAASIVQGAASCNPSSSNYPSTSPLPGSSGNTSNVAVIAGSVGGTLCFVLIGILIFVGIRRRSRRRQDALTDSLPTDSLPTDSLPTHSPLQRERFERFLSTPSFSRSNRSISTSQNTSRNDLRAAARRMVSAEARFRSLSEVSSSVAPRPLVEEREPEPELATTATEPELSAGGSALGSGGYLDPPPPYDDKNFRN
jgi:hypothetical protein